MRRKIIKPAIAATLLSGAAAVLLSYLPLDITRFAPAIAAQAESRFGYRLQIDRIVVKLLPALDITVQGITVSGDAGYTMTAQTIRLRVALLPLLANRIVIRQIEADEVFLTAAISEIKRRMKAKTGKKGTATFVDNLELRGLKIRLIDDIKTGNHANGKALEADIRKAYIHRQGDTFVLMVEGTTAHGAEFATSGRWESPQNAITGHITARDIDLERLQHYAGINLKKTGSFKGAADAKLSYSIGSKTSLNGEIAIRNVVARLTGLTRSLRLNGSAAVTVDIEDGRYRAALDGIKLDAGDFKVTGTINAKGSAGNADFTVTASTTPVPMSTLKRLAVAVPMPPAIGSRIRKIENETGTAAFDGISVSGSIRNGRLDTRELIDKLNLSIRLEKAALSYPGLSESFKDISGRVTFKRMIISAEEIEAHYGNIALQHLSARVAGLTAKPTYDISLKGIFDAGESARLAAELGESTAWWASRLADTRLSGDVNLSLNLNGQLGSAESIKYSGTARLRDITASYTDMPSRLGPANASVSFDNERVVINSLTAAIDDSSVEINGFVDNYTSKTASGNISTRASLTNETMQRYLWASAPAFSGKLNVRADISGSLDEFSATASVSTGAGPVDGKKTIRLSGAEVSAKGVKIHSSALSGIEAFETIIKDGEVRGHIFKDLKTTAVVTKDAVDGKIRLIIDDGEAFGSMQYYRGKDVPTVFDADVTLNGVKLEEILTAFGVKNPILSGPVFGKGVFSVRKGDGRPVSRLNGAITLRADKGRLYKFLLLNKIFSVINIISIDELFKEGLPYKTIAGAFTITDGVLATEGLYLDSDSMRMSALGRIDMTARTIESFIAIRPFVTLDKIISSVPLAGWVITGKEQSVVSLYYEVTGPLANPDVSPAMVKGIKEGIPGILERLITTEPKATPEQK